MARLVLTVIGDDQSGLVEALSGVVVDNEGNWEKSHLAHIGGKFAGIVMVTIPDGQKDALVRDLQPLEDQGLLEIVVETADRKEPAAPSTLLSLELVGVDHPGIIHDISSALAERDVSIEELETETKNAPMAGGVYFEARAVLRAPADMPKQEIIASLEALAHKLMVDIEVSEAPQPN